MEGLKKSCRTSQIISGIIVMVIGVVFFFIGGFDVVHFIGGGTIDANSDLSKYENKIVTVDMTNVVDVYEEITNSKNKHVFTGYAVMMSDENSDDDGYYFGVWRPSAKDSEMEKYMDDIWNYWFDEGEKPESIKITGILCKMDAEDKGFMQEFLDYYGEYGMDAPVQNYYIIEGKADKDADDDILKVQIFTGIAFVIVLIGGVIMLLAGRGWDKKLKAYIAVHPGTSMQTLENEISTGTFFANGGMVVTDTKFFYAESKVKVLDLKQICWGYHYITRGRNSVSQLVLCDVSGTVIRTNASEPVARDVLNCMSKKCPWIIVGYKSEWDQMYKKRRDEFLRLHYYDGKLAAGEVSSAVGYEDPIDVFEREQAAMRREMEQPTENTTETSSEPKVNEAGFEDFASWSSRQNNDDK